MLRAQTVVLPGVGGIVLLCYVAMLRQGLGLVRSMLFEVVRLEVQVFRQQRSLQEAGSVTCHEVKVTALSFALVTGM